ncbi:FAD binding domain [Popillia japonica]|uniref:FAD binding domain n=1 Tax=Popillia japonica TaxID=7064 RepID=A0AAW1LSI5_POPJA
MFSKVYRPLCVNFFRKNWARCYYDTPDFTKNNYNIQRGNYNSLDESHISYFRNLLGDDRLVMDLSDLEKYNIDWMNHLRGNSSLVLKPKTTREVSKILTFCNENKLAVCPQGGNTSIVGGSVPVLDEIVISTERMNQILDLDHISGVLVCEAGCILQDLDNKLSEFDLMMPLTRSRQQIIRIRPDDAPRFRC